MFNFSCFSAFDYCYFSETCHAYSSDNQKHNIAEKSLVFTNFLYVDV